MVQVLPGIPGFGEQLGQTLSGALGNVGQGLLNRRNERLDQKIINQLVSTPNATPLQQIQAFSSLSPKKQQTIGPLFNQFLNMQKSQQLQEQKIAAQQQQKQAVEEKEHEDVSELINELSDELVKGKTGFFNKYNKLTSKGRESRAYFDELALGIEKRLAAMVGKGALNQARFNYLKQNLPSSSNTDATNRGKLRALAKEFKVDVANPKFKRDENESKDTENRPSLQDIFQ